MEVFMRRATWVALAVFAAAFALFLPAGVAVSQEVQRVFVTNFPSVFPVEGNVSVKGPIRQAVLVPIKEVTVPPVTLKDSARWVDGGFVSPDGFSSMVLSLSGQIKGEVLKAGTVGAVLLPDEEPVIRAFEERGDLQFALEVTAAGVSAASPYFASSQPRYQVGFPRYRIYFYNTADKAVTVNLFAYLTN
jgi:DNA-binding beta-propeller fold protein YncE